MKTAKHSYNNYKKCRIKLCCVSQELPKEKSQKWAIYVVRYSFKSILLNLHFSTLNFLVLMPKLARGMRSCHSFPWYSKEKMAVLEYDFCNVNFGVWFAALGLPKCCLLICWWYWQRHYWAADQEEKKWEGV